MHHRWTASTLPSFFFFLSFFIFVHGQSSSSSGVSSSVTRSGSGNSSTLVNLSSSGSPTNSASYPSLSGYSTCVTNCLELAVSNRSCISVTQTNCYCNRTNATPFKNNLISCIDGQCQAELASAETLAEAFCAVGNSSTSLSFPPITSSGSSSLSSLSSLQLSSLPSISSVKTSSTSSSSSSSPSRSSNNALSVYGEGHGITSTLMFGVFISLVSVLIGAFSV